jgi:hypothetical protein
MSVCRGCGGEVGRDCFNPEECEWISRDIERRSAEERALATREPTVDEYCAAQGHPLYGVDYSPGAGGVGRCYCGAKTYPEAEREEMLVAGAAEGMGC